MSKKCKAYFIADNGIKIELNGSGPAQFYAKEQIRNEISTAFQVPKDMLFPVSAEVPAGKCLNVALTDELRSKGSVEIKLEFHKE